MKYSAPLTLAELSAALAETTERSVILAGGTDWVIQRREQRLEPDMIVYPGGIPGINVVDIEEGRVRIGAMATMAEIAGSLAHIREFAAIADAAGNVGSPQIRNKATIGGNLCTASPAGDMLPVSFLFDAQIELIDSEGVLTRVPVSEFVLGSKKTALNHKQAVISIYVGIPGSGMCVSAFQKIGSRKDVTISRESMGGLLRADAQGTVSEARFVLGAVNDVPLRLPEAESLVIGKNISALPVEALTEMVSAAVGASCRPGSRQYKTAAAKGLTLDLLDKLKKRFNLA